MSRDNLNAQNPFKPQTGSIFNHLNPLNPTLSMKDSREADHRLSNCKPFLDKYLHLPLLRSGTQTYLPTIIQSLKTQLLLCKLCEAFTFSPDSTRKAGLPNQYYQCDSETLAASLSASFVLYYKC